MSVQIPITQVPATSYKLKQDVLFVPVLPGGGTEGAVRLQNINSFSIGPTAETTTVQGTMLANYGQSLDAITEPGDVTISMTMTRQARADLTIAMLGKGGALDESAGGTVASEAIPVYSNQYAFLEQRSIDWTSLKFLGAELTVTDATAFTVGELVSNTTTPGEIGYVHSSSTGTSLFVILSENGTLPTNGDGISGADSAATDTATVVASDDTIAVLDTDYSIVQSRYISFPDAGTWQKGRMQVSYDYTSYKADTVAIGAETLIKGAFTMFGTNLVNGQDVEIRLRQANLSPDGETSFVTDGDDRSVVSLTGIAETPEGFSDAGVIYLLAADA